MLRWVVAASALCAVWLVWAIAVLELEVRLESYASPYSLEISLATLGLACVALGAIVARRWAPTIAFGLVVVVPVPDHCVGVQVDYDVPTLYCAGISAEDLPLWLTVTGGSLAAGVALRVAATHLRTRRAHHSAARG